MTPPIEFDTDRLRLRQWQPADRAPFAKLNADPRVMEFFPAQLSRAESDALADRCESTIAEKGWGPWAVELRTSGEFIGFVGLNVPSSQLPFSPCVEIAWRLAAHVWGRGNATEAARGALKVGFDLLALHEIVSFTAQTNARSRAVMKRLGMREAPAPFEHPALPPGHRLRSHSLYRIALNDYRSCQ